MTQALGKYQEAWLVALESGEYGQIEEKLRDTDPFTHEVVGYCCLGVACDLMVDPGEEWVEDGTRWNDDQFEVYFEGEYQESVGEHLPKAIEHRYGFYGEGGDLDKRVWINRDNHLEVEQPDYDDDNVMEVENLITLNDELNFTFKEIAAFVRKDPSRVFGEVY